MERTAADTSFEPPSSPTWTRGVNGPGVADDSQHPWRAAHRHPAARHRSKWTFDPFRISLFLLTVVTLSRIHQPFEAVARLRPALILGISALAFAILRPRALALRNLTTTWPPRVLGAFTVLVCLSIPFGISLGGSAAFFLSNFSKVLIYTVLLMAAIRMVSDLRLFIWAYVISVGVLVWMSLFVFEPSEVAGTYTARIGDMYRYDSNDVGLILVVGLPLVVLTFQTSRLPGKLLSAIIFLGTGLALARGGSRAAFLGLAVVGLLLLFSMRQLSWAKRLVIVASLGVALFLATPQGYWKQMSTITDTTEDYNWTALDGRRQLALRGLRYIADRPLLGLGLDNFRRAEGTLSDKAQNSPEGQGVLWTAPHNSYIQIGAEVGIPALILWCSLLFGGILYVRKVRRRLPNSWLRGDPDQRFTYLTSTYLPISMIAFAFLALFLSFAYEDPVYILTGYLTGLLALTATAMQGSQTPTARRGGRSSSGYQSIAYPPRALGKQRQWQQHRRL